MSVLISRFITLCGIITVIIFCLPLCVSASGVHYLKQMVDGATLHTVYVNLRDPSVQVTPAVALDESSKRLSFPGFMDEYEPLAQCTGTFFDFHSGEAIGDLVVHGQLIPSSTGMGTALAITPDNKAFMFDPAPSTPRDWSRYDSVMQGGVRLIRHGIIDVDPAGQGFHDRYMCRCTHRIAVGVLPGDRLMLLGTYDDMLLPRLAELMLRLGCQDAMALDGGGSTAFAYNGKRLLNTGRKLANVLMVVRRPYDPVAQLSALFDARDRAVADPGSDLLDTPFLLTTGFDEETEFEEEATLWNADGTLNWPSTTLTTLPTPTSTRRSSLFDLLCSWITPLLHWRP